MKLIRVVTRLALLSLAAAAFVGLTGIYGDSVRLPVPGPRWQEIRQHRRSAPDVSRFPGFVAAGVESALFALAGRKIFRLRLSRASRSEGQPILLNLHRERTTDAI